MFSSHIKPRCAFFLCLVLTLVPGCSRESATPPESAADGKATLASLEKVDDFPLYKMTFYGDYGFARYLQTGVLPFTSLNMPGADGEVKWACTCFSAFGSDSAVILGRNFDWRDCIPLLLFTKAPGAYASVSMVDLEYFGYSRGNLPDGSRDNSELLQAPFMPFDGMNEKGVAVGMMAVPEAQAPSSPGRVTIGEIQAIRLVLDYAASVNEAITLIDRYNIRMEDPPIHYLVTDRSGQSAVIEFVAGQKYVIRGDDRWQVSTNFVIHGSEAPGVTPCWRYNSASGTLKQAAGFLSDASALQLLQQVSQASTVWSTLYKTEALRVLVAPGRRYSAAREFSLAP